MIWKNYLCNYGKEEEKMKDFKFWCQKVLPLTYDNSLSYYEVLCKVVTQLNEVIEGLNKNSTQVTELSKEYETLKSYVEHYFDNLNLQEEINNKLDEMASSGYFDNLLLKNLWSFNKEEMEAYRNHARHCLSSYLSRSFGTSTVISNVLAKEKVCWEYSTNYGYMGLFGRYAEFKTNATQDTSVGSLPVFYGDCSVFTSLITKGIDYENSPYKYAIIDGGTDKETLYRKALEYGTIREYPFTFDWLNNLNTDTMAFISSKAGIPLLKMCEREHQNSSIVYHLLNLRTLETGDVMFRGVETNQTAYKGINHCGTFVKNLEELITDELTGFQVEDSSIGYIVEVTGSDDVTAYGNVLRVSRFEDWAEYGGGNYGVTVYATKPISCTLTSNKANSELSGVVHCYDWDVLVTQERTDDGGYTVAEVVPHQCGGVIMQLSADLNDFVYDGQYYVPTQNVLNSLKNTPVTDRLFVLRCEGFVKNRKFGTQTVLCYGSNNTQVYVRSKANDTWCDWQKLN